MNIMGFLLNTKFIYNIYECTFLAARCEVCETTISSNEAIDDVKNRKSFHA
jgi:hypothetical protein